MYILTPKIKPRFQNYIKNKHRRKFKDEQTNHIKKDKSNKYTALI